MKTILHLCADLGSDSFPYQIDPDYDVIMIGKDIGVENYQVDREIHGIIANPVCTEFSFAREGYLFGTTKKQTIDLESGLFLLKHCQRIIKDAAPAWWVIENPFNGSMKDHLGTPDYSYEPWMFGSPWTKKTALWGNFRKPFPLFTKWGQVQQNEKLYIRPGRPKPSLAFLHKSAIHNIPEFAPFIDRVDSDNGFRSLCSQGFANEFKKINP